MVFTIPPSHADILMILGKQFNAKTEHKDFNVNGIG